MSSPPIGVNWERVRGSDAHGDFACPLLSSCRFLVESGLCALDRSRTLISNLVTAIEWSNSPLTSRLGSALRPEARGKSSKTRKLRSLTCARSLVVGASESRLAARAAVTNFEKRWGHRNVLERSVGTASRDTAPGATSARVGRRSTKAGRCSQHSDAQKHDAEEELW
jgi:hypothetical protein